ncbi:MAG: hypothetical protein J7L46_03855 [Bacteroidales bacterium]|nr:hypothetical protein [Bacteroidales bacterium]
MRIIKCPKCGVKNRIKSNADNKIPICGRCGARLFQEEQNHPTKPNSQTNKTKRNIQSVILIFLLTAVLFGIVVAPRLMRKDFSKLVAAEAKKTEILKGKYKKELAVKKVSLEKELSEIDPKTLRAKVTQHYKMILEARKSFDKKFALSPREKAQLRMRNLASDSTKSLHDVIRSIAKEASPPGAEINVYESSKGIVLNIDFEMASMTSGEHGTQTKHHTKDSLRKEVISLISRVTNDIFKFCRGLNIRTIYVGCRHYVITTYPDGSKKKENMLLYKIKVQENQIPHLTNDPFIDVYSTTNYLKIQEDNFDKIEIKTRRL